MSRVRDFPAELLRAISVDDLDSVKTRLKSIDSLDEDKDGYTMLHWCAQENAVDVARYLFSEYQPDINRTDRLGQSPLRIAAGEGHVEMVNLLIASAARVDQGEIERGVGSPLQIALIYGHSEVVDLLLKAGANPYLADDQGKSAIDYFQENKEHYAFSADLEKRILRMRRTES